MKIAIVNLGQIVSGDWQSPFVGGDTIITDGDRIARVGSASVAEVENADVIIDAGGMTAISRSDRLPCPHYFRRLHAAATGSRFPRKLLARRYYHRDLSIGGACSGPPERSRGSKGASACGTTLFLALPPRRHEGYRRLGYSGAGPFICRFPGVGGQRRNAGEGRLRRSQDGV